jgi:hypothetical protein
MVRLILSFFFCCINGPLFSKEKIGVIAKVAIRKFSRNVHYSASYNCTNYDTIFRGHKNLGYETLDTLIIDKLIIKKINYLRGKLTEFQKREICHGQPHIKVEFFLMDGKTETYYIEGRSYVLNHKTIYLMGNKSLENFFDKIGGFQ